MLQLKKNRISGRNWAKLRLTGFNLDISVLTEREKKVYRILMNMRATLLEKWDEETEKFIGHPLPPYKCQSCGKRSNKKYTLKFPSGEEQIFCYSHYKAFKDESD